MGGAAHRQGDQVPTDPQAEEVRHPDMLAGELCSDFGHHKGCTTGVVRNSWLKGHLGGSVGGVSDFGSGHDPKVLGLSPMSAWSPLKIFPPSLPPSLPLSLGGARVAELVKPDFSSGHEFHGS